MCSEHFVNGWHSEDPFDENYVTNIFLYKEKSVDVERQNRTTRRNIQKVRKLHVLKKQINHGYTLFQEHDSNLTLCETFLRVL